MFEGFGGTLSKPNGTFSLFQRKWRIHVPSFQGKVEAGLERNVDKQLPRLVFVPLTELEDFMDGSGCWLGSTELFKIYGDRWSDFPFSALFEITLDTVFGGAIKRFISDVVVELLKILRGSDCYQCKDFSFK